MTKTRALKCIGYPFDEYPNTPSTIDRVSLDSFLLTFSWAYLLVDKVDLDGKCDSGSARKFLSGERQAQGKKASRFHPPINDHLPPVLTVSAISRSLIRFGRLKSVAILLQMKFEKVAN
jgi:hypothetical protein